MPKSRNAGGEPEKSIGHDAKPLRSTRNQALQQKTPSLLGQGSDGVHSLVSGRSRKPIGGAET